MACSISEDASAGAEIRTKVFRMGAPLLRSTIPVSLRGRRSSAAGELPRGSQEPADAAERDAAGGSDVETVLSLSDVELEDNAALSVTLDFPC
mmetsp:Transcript_49952/g.129668  ORF Transcript_49952/g.129668 Transcript_49952/m.129668 type:complete len:93 (+) Transcript_49952:1-279(+)